MRPAEGFQAVNEAMSNFDLVAEEKIERERMTRKCTMPPGSNAQLAEARAAFSGR